MMWAKMAEVGENPQTDTESQKQKKVRDEYQFIIKC